MTRQNKINAAKNDSVKNNNSVLVVENRKNREFMRFEDGKLVEYDLTKAYGKSIRLADEELEALNNLNLNGVS